MLIMYESIERMFNALTDYDYFLNIEDDVLVSKEMIESCIYFNSISNLNEVYLPNRMERGKDGSVYCVDLLAIQGWHEAYCRSFQHAMLGVAKNHHSALFFLSRQQMHYASQRINLSRRDRIFSGPMASAFANVHFPFLLWRSRSDLLAHHVIHLDNWLQSPSDEKASLASSDRLAQEDPHKATGCVDEVIHDGAVIKIRGWVISRTGNPAGKLSLNIDGNEVLPEDCQVRRFDRPDVVSAFPEAKLTCGFEFAFPVRCLLALLDHPNSAHVNLIFRPEMEHVALVIQEGALRQGIQSVLAALPRVPGDLFMTEPESRWLSELMRQAGSFLEYGTGEASIQAVALAIPTVVVVESDLLRLEVLRYKLEATASSSNCHLRHIDIGWRSNSHDRASDAYWRTYEQQTLETCRYPLEVWEFCQSQQIAPDLVLIRGQFRLACLLATILFAKLGCRVVVADYIESAYDDYLEKLIRPVAIVGSAAEFLVSVQTSAERERLWHLLLRSLINPK